MEKKYYVRKDLQGEDFGYYREFTAEEWREQALEWCDMDANEELYKSVKKLKSDEVIDFVADMWTLDIVESPKIGFEAICRKTIDTFNLMDIVVVDGKIIQGIFADDETANKYKGKIPQNMEAVQEIFGNADDYGTFDTWIELYHKIVYGLISDDLRDLGEDDFYLDKDTLWELDLIEHKIAYRLIGENAKISIKKRCENLLSSSQGQQGKYFSLDDLYYYICQFQELYTEIVKRKDFEVVYE